MDINKFSVKQLRYVVKHHNLHTQIRGYSKMVKKDLIINILKHLVLDNNDHFNEKNKPYNIRIK